MICGVDEAGRGPLAGPVYAAAVVLDPEHEIPGLNDSKKLTTARRAILFDEIMAKAAAYGIAFATVAEVEELNILEATLLAMRRAIAMITPLPELLLVDGSIARGFDIPARAVVRGDATEPCIMAASILAKVTRDRIMTELDAEYPGYGFAKHKGYGTREHRDAILRLGATKEHRALFLRKIL